jgi:hypothetical protein
MQVMNYDLLSNDGFQRIARYQTEAQQEALVEMAHQYKPKKISRLRYKLGLTLLHWGLRLSGESKVAPKIK